MSARPSATSLSRWLSTLARLVLAGVLGVAGALKVADPAASVAAVRAYQLLPEPVERIVGYGLPFLELGLAALLVLGMATRLAAVLAGLLMAAFVAGIASAWARGLAVDCGCFGGGGAVDPRTPRTCRRSCATPVSCCWRLGWCGVRAGALSVDRAAGPARATRAVVAEPDRAATRTRVKEHIHNATIEQSGGDAEPSASVTHEVAKGQH